MYRSGYAMILCVDRTTSEKVTMREEVVCGGWWWWWW